ncbi:MAG TPA: 2-hydroxy-3-keto-5-methylthiopentenyl-1-phosphate phosphatase, partial [Bacteroidota bacterium]
EFVNHGKATKFVPSFPYRDEECDRCGNCKRNHLLTISGDDDVLVYVGDGISDRCPVRYADIVFAKHSLVSYCQRQNISYYRYRTFGDVQARLEALLAQKRVRQRREAAIARRDVFMRG